MVNCLFTNDHLLMLLISGLLKIEARPAPILKIAPKPKTESTVVLKVIPKAKADSPAASATPSVKPTNGNGTKVLALLGGAYDDEDNE